jgi:hypothetical protein
VGLERNTADVPFVAAVGLGMIHIVSSEERLPTKDLSRLGGGEGREVGLLEGDEAAGELE